MRQIMSTAATAVIVSLLTLTVAGAMAQTEPATEAITPAVFRARNADKVDGKDAVYATKRPGLRATKLVATDKKGFLPDNIVRPLWHLIQNRPAILADGQVGWGEVANRPAVLADDQVGWGEVVGKPAGFADDVDDAGVTKVRVTRVESAYTSVAAGTANDIVVPCPSGRAIGGGFNADSTSVQAARSYPSAAMAEWNVTMRNDGPGLSHFRAYAICLTVEPVGRFETAGKSVRR